MCRVGCLDRGVPLEAKAESAISERERFVSFVRRELSLAERVLGMQLEPADSEAWRQGGGEQACQESNRRDARFPSARISPRNQPSYELVLKIRCEYAPRPTRWCRARPFVRRLRPAAGVPCTATSTRRRGASRVQPARARGVLAAPAVAAASAAREARPRQRQPVSSPDPNLGRGSSRTWRNCEYGRWQVRRGRGAECEPCSQ